MKLPSVNIVVVLSFIISVRKSLVKSFFFFFFEICIVGDYQVVEVAYGHCPKFIYGLCQTQVHQTIYRRYYIFLVSYTYRFLRQYNCNILVLTNWTHTYISSLLPFTYEHPHWFILILVWMLSSIWNTDQSFMCFWSIKNDFKCLSDIFYRFPCCWWIKYWVLKKIIVSIFGHFVLFFFLRCLDTFSRPLPRKLVS